MLPMLPDYARGSPLNMLQGHHQPKLLLLKREEEAGERAVFIFSVSRQAGAFTSFCCRRQIKRAADMLPAALHAS